MAKGLDLSTTATATSAPDRHPDALKREGMGRAEQGVDRRGPRRVEPAPRTSPVGLADGRTEEVEVERWSDRSVGRSARGDVMRRGILIIFGNSGNPGSAGLLRRTRFD
jgi:hypothetical protein